MCRETVIFDGECGVCRALKNWAVRHDVAGELEFIAYQTKNLSSLSPGLTPEAAGRALYFVRRDGMRFRGARAVFETMRRLPGAWGALGAVLSFPPFSFLAEPFYYLFARYRGTFSHWLGLDRCDVQGLDLP